MTVNLRTTQRPEIEIFRISNTALVDLKHRIIYASVLFDLSDQLYVYTGWKNTCRLPSNKENESKIAIKSVVMDKKELYDFEQPSSSVPSLYMRSVKNSVKAKLQKKIVRSTKWRNTFLTPLSKDGFKCKHQIRLWVAYLESLNGDILLDQNNASTSYARCRNLLVWCELWRRWKHGQRVAGRILNEVYGGYSVGIAGFVAFLPASRFFHVSRHGIGFLDWFEIANMNTQTRNIVVTQFIR